MPSITSPRKTSGPLPIDSPVMVSEHNPAPSSWARTTAQPTSQSKTSQYIDKITSENERYKRDLKASELAREDDKLRLAAARAKAEDTRSELQRLQVEADANKRALERKDRKVTELEAQMESEVKRRKLAEQRADEALKMLGDTRSETQRQLAVAYEQKILAETNLNAAKNGLKRINDGREKRMARIGEDLKELRMQRREDAAKLKRYELVTDSLKAEYPRNDLAEHQLVDALNEYKREHHKEIDDLAKEIARLRLSVRAKEDQVAKLAKEMKETNDKMKWVMAQQQRQTSS